MIKQDGLWLLNGDCLERMKEIPDGSVDMILTDPPYGMNLIPQRESGKFHNVKIKNDADLSWTDDFFDKCFKLLKQNTCAMFFCSHHGVSEFITSAKLAGFDIKNLLIWDKKHLGMGNNWRPVHELVLLCTKGRFVTKSKNKTTILSFSKVHHSKMVHPTEKPIELLQHLIDEPDYNPQIILDPFMGSGTTGVAALRNGRKFIGIELDTTYYGIACDRVLTESSE